MSETDIIELAEQSVLKDISWCLGFINQAPEDHRGHIFITLMKEVYAYKKKKIEWEATREELQESAKYLKRQIPAFYKNRQKSAIEFLAQLSVVEGDDAFSGLNNFQISDGAKLEIMQLIYKLKVADESGEVDQRVKDISLITPTKKRVETLIKEIHQKYNISGVSDTLKDILPLI